jgi:S-adenosylmethionine:tRNA ribosyltransferase-isomerase
MRKSDFHYDLPAELIAQAPLSERSASRLLCLRRHSHVLADRDFSDLPSLLEPGDLLVFNDTRVIPARLFGHKETGGKVEILLERLIDENCCLALLRSSKSPRVGQSIWLADGLQLTVTGREADFFMLQAPAGCKLLRVFEQYGQVPLPPYIERPPDELDTERYQTVFAARPGAVAAPTASLHFDHQVLAQLAQRGVESGMITLHVGAGTFQPVRVDDLTQHHMHAEYLEVGSQLVEQVRQTRARGGRVIAAGTTSMRALEAASASGELQPMAGETRLFIMPGYQFRSVDGLVTNFHLPESTLLMLVAAFAGYEVTMSAYAHAIAERYRFFSYGDAMLILPGSEEY